jgi:hypothetical protein
MTVKSFKILGPGVNVKQHFFFFVTVYKISKECFSLLSFSGRSNICEKDWKLNMILYSKC